MKLLIYSIFLLSLLGLISACTGGRSRFSAAGHCSEIKVKKNTYKKYDPIPLEIEDGGDYKLIKLEGLNGSETAEETAEKLGDGDFEYVSSDYFYEKLLVDSDLNMPYQRIHFTHSLTADNEDTFDTYCLSNMPYNGVVETGGAEAISKFSVAGEKLTVADTLSVSAKWAKNKMNRQISFSAAPDAVTSPKDYLHTLKADFRVYKVENNEAFTHEMRVLHQIDENTTITIMVRYK